MNYRANRRHWKPGDHVLHDCDAKRPDMLMRVVEYLPNGEVRTEYVDDELRSKWGAGKRSALVNPLGALHDPRRFGVLPSPAARPEAAR